MNAPLHVPRPRSRLRLLLGVVFAVIVAAATAALPGTARAATTICSNQTGTNGGYYYQMWSNGTGSACITLNSGNSYSSLVERHRRLRRRRRLESRQQPDGELLEQPQRVRRHHAGIALRLVDEPARRVLRHGELRRLPPTAGTYMGQVTSDGGTYNIYEHQQVNQPSIEGTATFEQYLAIRTSPVSSGTITTSNFIKAWASHGMNLGTLNYQILATESFGGGSGNSSVTVNSGGGSGGGGGGGGGGGSSGCTATLSAGSSGSNWYNLNVSVTGSSTWTVTMNLVAPAVVYSTWNVNATYPSQYVLKATPNGNGNNWGVTISPNGQWTWPTVSCSTG